MRFVLSEHRVDGLEREGEDHDVGGCDGVPIIAGRGRARIRGPIGCHRGSAMRIARADDDAEPGKRQTLRKTASLLSRAAQYGDAGLRHPAILHAPPDSPQLAIDASGNTIPHCSKYT